MWRKLLAAWIATSECFSSIWILQMYTPQFPKRLDRGESFDYYLLRERLDKALIPYEEKMSLDEPFSIRIDEVTRGTQYYKTKWTLRTFIGK